MRRRHERLRACAEREGSNGEREGGSLLRLVPRRPGDDGAIELDAYPTVSKSKADGKKAVQAKRTHDIALDSSIASRSVTIAKGNPAGNPNYLFLSKASRDAGGGLFASNGKLLGVMIGRGEKTKGYYAASLHDESIRGWIEAIVMNPSRPTKSQALARARGFDDSDFDDSDFGGGDFGGGGGGEEPKESEPDAANMPSESGGDGMSGDFQQYLQP